MPSIHWNVVVKNIQLDDQAHDNLRQKIGPLERELAGFPAEKLHLQVLLEKHATKPLHTTTLTLRTPADIVVSQDSAAELMEAVEDAFADLQHRLKFLSGPTAREALRHRPKARAQGQKQFRFAPEPQPAGVGPQSPKDVIRQFFREHYNRMLRHVRRHLRQEEMTGELPKGALDPRDIVHEVARQAERSPDKKPARVSWIVWLFHLLHEELRRQLGLFRQEQAEDIPTEKRTTLPELRLSALQPLEQMVERVIEPEAVRIEDIVPNPEVLPPDQAVEEKELLDHLEESIKAWPQIERHVFELYFVQGFEPEAIAQIISLPVKQVRETVTAVHTRLREEMLREEVLT